MAHPPTSKPVEPSENSGEANAVDGFVVVDGPGAVAVTMTPDAAEEMADRLRAAAEQARMQGG